MNSIIKMYKVGVDISPKQQSRLRNGHKVRIKKGTGVCLVVSPGNYDITSRAFRRNKGVEIQLSPDEIEENRMVSPEMQQDDVGEIKGMGLFSKVGKTLKSAGSKTLSGLAYAERQARKNPYSRLAIKTGVPMLAAAGTEAALMSMGVDPVTASFMASGAKEGTNYGLSRAGYGLYSGAQGRGFGGTLTAGMEDLKRQTMGSHYANQYDASAIKDSLRSKRGQMISGRGSFISSSQSGMHQAMQSQPYGENFSMQNQLPPQYQRLHNGGSSEGRGIYA